jgi:hypothetical protein
MLMEDEPHLLTDIPREEWEMSFLVNAKGIIIGFMDEMGAHRSVISSRAQSRLLAGDRVQVRQGGGNGRSRLSALCQELFLKI